MWKGCSIWGIECLATAGVIGTHMVFEATHAGHSDIGEILAKSLDLLYGIVVLGSVLIAHLIAEHKRINDAWWSVCTGGLFVVVVSSAFISGAAGMQSFLRCGEIFLITKMYPVSLGALIAVGFTGILVQVSIGTHKVIPSPIQ